MRKRTMIIYSWINKKVVITGLKIILLENQSVRKKSENKFGRLKKTYYLCITINNYMKSITKIQNYLAATTVISAAVSVVSAIFNYCYTSEVMTFTQEFSAFGLSW